VCLSVATGTGYREVCPHLFRFVQCGFSGVAGLGHRACVCSLYFPLTPRTGEQFLLNSPHNVFVAVIVVECMIPCSCCVFSRVAPFCCLWLTPPCGGRRPAHRRVQPTKNYGSELDPPSFSRWSDVAWALESLCECVSVFAHCCCLSVCYPLPVIRIWKIWSNKPVVCVCIF